MNTIKNKEYNVRLIFDENGNAQIAWAHGLYRVSKNLREWRSVPESIRCKIIKALSEGTCHA